VGDKKVAFAAEDVTTIQPPSSSGNATAPAVTVALGRGKPAKRSTPAEGVVQDDASEEAMMALGRRAVANVTLSLGRNKVILSSSTASSTIEASSSAPAVDSSATARAGLSLPQFSPTELLTPQGWGGRKSCRSSRHCMTTDVSSCSLR
jgi:hypothetical protein